MKFFNTLSQKKEFFRTIVPHKVKMYCCGITPYSTIHLGHMRTFFSYDLLYRTLIDHGYTVEWARNITDVDDKIILKSISEHKSCSEISNRYISEQNKYLKIFNLVTPQFEPRVTENISEIISMIQALIQKEFAYVTITGVYFRVRKFADYGKLSKNKIDDLKKGARIDIDENKEDALDFALWKFAKPEEIFWESPWSKGRPGWHIECSAMIHSLFGNEIDIHMGGRDLIFPHHEAEIAQSEACTGCRLANYWIHCGMVTLYGEKMSKSTNHFVSIEDFLNKYPPEVLRLLFLSVSYSQPLDFTFELASENLKKLSRIYRFISLIDNYVGAFHNVSSTSTFENQNSSDISIFATLPQLKQQMREHLSQDMNSAMAIANLFEFIKNVNASIVKLEKNNQKLSTEDVEILQNHWENFKDWCRKNLAILTKTSQEFFDELHKLNFENVLSEEEILKKLEARNLFREQKDWKSSDAIRDELLKQGVQIMDTPRGTKWFLH